MNPMMKGESNVIGHGWSLYEPQHGSRVEILGHIKQSLT